MTYHTAEWFPDGKKVLVNGNAPGKPSRTWIFSLDGNSLEPLTAEGVRATNITPDGRFYILSDPGKVLMAPVAGGAPKKIAELESGESVVRWSGDQRYLFLRRIEGATAEILRLEITTGHKEKWRTLQVPELGAEFLGPVALSADGKVCAAAFQHDLANLYLVTGLR
jgi:Tol biopolymer transport system component